MEPGEVADIENRLARDMTKTLRSYGVGHRQLGTEMFSLLLDELVMDAMHQVERFIDWPEEVTYE